MSNDFTAPGVFVSEIPAGQHAIQGVTTATTAFVGRAARGPVDDPVSIDSYSAFEDVFGGLSATSEMSYAVADYFRNGGRDATVVRLFHADNAPAAINRARQVTPNRRDADDTGSCDPGRCDRGPPSTG